MTTRRNLIKTLCASAMLAPFARVSDNYTRASENYNPELEKWAKNHAINYTLHFIDGYEKPYIDKYGNNYISVWPIAFAHFKMRNSGEFCKMVIEFPANIRCANVPCNPTKADFDKARQQIYIQLKPFMIEYAKKQMSAHPEITVYA